MIAAIGHTDATFDQAVAAIAAGATVATHLGNAMSPLQHRDPGVVGACLTAPEICCELIVDGHHLHPSFVRLAAASKGADGIVLITDAIAAAGAGDGRYRLGRLDVDVRDGMATLAEGGSLAGSTLTMDAAYRNAVAAGLDEVVASRAASPNPARLLGIDGDVGSDRGRQARRPRRPRRGPRGGRRDRRRRGRRRFARHRLTAALASGEDPCPIRHLGMFSVGV